MIRQIVIEAEPPDDAQLMFSLTINANLIAEGVTAAQAYYLVGEIFQRIGPPERAETVMFDANGGESVRVYASNARSRASPSILSVLARRRRRDVAIDDGSTTSLSTPSLCSTR